MTALSRAHAPELPDALLLSIAPVALALAVSTTIFGRGIDSNLLSILLIIGALGGGVHLILRLRLTSGYQKRQQGVVPLVYSSLVLLFFALRLRLVDDGSSRWWLLTQISEDNAAWLNMANQVGNLDEITPSVTKNLGHTMPLLLWCLTRLVRLLPGSTSPTTLNPLISDEVILILRLNVLLIAIGAFLAASLVDTVLELAIPTKHCLIRVLAGVPAVVGSVLCGMVLSRFGYLSALMALVLFQATLLLIIRQKNAHHPLLIPSGLLLVGLAWFPMIPISTLGLIIFLIFQWRRKSPSWPNRKIIGSLAAIACITVQLTHLAQLLRRYPDVDRAQGSMWIASQNMMPLFLALLFVGVLTFHSHFRSEVRASGILALCVPSAWLCVVWLNDLIRTGGPAHYGTTKLTLIVVYALLPLIVALTILGALRFCDADKYVVVASASAICLTLSILSLSNDANGRWPRKPSKEELGQNTTLGLIPAFATAKLQSPSQIACLFVGDFEATGTWQGSYACNRWGASALGLDGPLNEALRHVLLGNSQQDEKIAQLRSSGFFDNVVIISDQPEKLVQLNPWRIFDFVGTGSFVIPSENSRVIPFGTFAEKSEG